MSIQIKRRLACAAVLVLSVAVACAFVARTQAQVQLAPAKKSVTLMPGHFDIMVHDEQQAVRPSEREDNRFWKYGSISIDNKITIEGVPIEVAMALTNPSTFVYRVEVEYFEPSQFESIWFLPQHESPYADDTPAENR